MSESQSNMQSRPRYGALERAEAYGRIQREMQTAKEQEDLKLAGAIKRFAKTDLEVDPSLLCRLIDLKKLKKVDSENELAEMEKAYKIALLTVSRRMTELKKTASKQS